MKKRPRKPVQTTLKDIAKEARVSPTTVSLALDNKATSRVSQATRQRIVEIAERLNYRPNYLARSLVTRKTQTIGLVVTTLLNPIYAEIAQDIIDRANETGYGVFTCSVRGRLEDERRSVEGLLSRGVDGVIICSSFRRDPVVYELARQGVPLVLTLRTVEQEPGDPPVDCIAMDSKRGAFMATEHLLKMGHRRLALILGPQETSSGFDRQLGARAAFEAHGVEPDPDLILAGDFHRRSGYALTKKLLRLDRPPTACFAANDHMALGVIEALREAGLRVPEDMAVVGFDDIEMAGLAGIDLTTISQKKATLGRLAVDRLIQKIGGESVDSVQRIILEPVLVIRNSCGFRARGGSYGQLGGQADTLRLVQKS